MLNFLLGLWAGLMIGLALYILKTKRPKDGTIVFDPLGEDILGLSLEHDLYSLSKKKELRIKVTVNNVKEAVNGNYLEDLEKDLTGNRLRNSKRN